ncbi:MAG: prepilin-type N-terminal cleavage/methylation domain-containing protein [Archangiaceae bacterium]|nr:prepilin-type N-terminal cleavage/methylation domain-containing protein [Archangiaceae bacterium]
MLRRRRGMTLLELMTVVAVVGIMTGLSALSFMSVRSTSRSRETTRLLVTAMRTARMMAVTSGVPTGVHIGTMSDVNGSRLLLVFRKQNAAAPANAQFVPPAGVNPDLVVSRNNLVDIGLGNAVTPELLSLQYDTGGGYQALADGEALEVIYDSDGRPNVLQVPAGGGPANDLTLPMAASVDRHLLIRLSDPREFRGTATRNPSARCTEVTSTGTARNFRAPLPRIDCV